MYEAGLELAKRSDLLIHHFILHSARAAAELTGTPAITVAFAHYARAVAGDHPARACRGSAPGAT